MPFHLSKKRSPNGFTLIELLIVIAIILILIAIALPNFLAAMVRAKVVRVRADMRSMATAQEAYFTDWDTYALEYSHGMLNDFPYEYVRRTTLIVLSTPIAYLKDALLIDVFGAASLGPRPQTLFLQSAAGDYGARDSKARSFGARQAAESNPPDFDVLYPKTVFAFVSAGPDAKDDTNMFPYPWSNCSPASRFLEGCLYTPTNGTQSLGDLVVTNGRMPRGWAYGGTNAFVESLVNPWAPGFN